MISRKNDKADKKKERDDSEDFHVEEVIDRPFSKALAGRLLHYLKPYRLLVASSIFLILVNTGLSLIGPLLIKEAVDGPLALPAQGIEERELTGLGQSMADIGAWMGLDPITVGATAADRAQWLWLLVGIYASTLLVQILMRYGETMVLNLTGQNVMRDLRLQVFAHLQKQSASFYHTNPVGRLVTRVTSDVESLNELFTSGFVTLVGDILAITGIVIMLFWTNSDLALMVLSTAPVLLISTTIFRKFARKHYREVRRRLAHINAFTQESISGMEVIQVCRREKEQATRYSEINGKLRDAHLKSIFWYALFFPTVELLSVVALGIIVVQGGQRIEAGTATFGEFFLFWTYLTRLFTPVRDLAEKYNLLQSAMASSERVFSVLDSDTSLPEGEHHSDEDLAPLNEIRFEGVSFAYDPKTPVLQNVSFSVKKGETVAIVGATGAGKSTIINLLLRFHDPVSGSITLNGDDIRESSLVEHRERFGLVLQDVAVLSRTLGENIRFDRDIQRSKILEALEQVNGQDIIARQSQGLDEPMMERGRTLSSGERQLISFARALAGNPEILVLDEATSHVDTETETRIQAAIDKMVEGRTSVIVAHRLSTVRKADRILVLHHGQLRESGTHDELVSQDGIYAKLVKLQFQSR
ncbi:MAG: ATP-binding cassette domain-containing protein [Planctomycetia bacterium]|jgi:ATP-binding cassette, subfamily B, multidrug efflux pump|nr:ATP-binding cassette domain-containing protein [Planctomycetia bacterium]NCF98734.1 ATP-binding cassette domain-containing protein [Planctomycetia bacterium]NCG13498.1 ATP-binding cassette domain-containing protein [Planctomycetia bacterium]NCG57348.1 ATP-binding cassette domain-containing protein [Pseudomonadota bacterium]